MREEKGSVLLMVMIIALVLSLVLLVVSASLERKLFQLRRKINFEGELVQLNHDFNEFVNVYSRQVYERLDHACHLQGHQGEVNEDLVFEGMMIDMVGYCHEESYRKMVRFRGVDGVKGQEVTLNRILFQEKGSEAFKSEVESYEIVKNDAWEVTILTGGGMYRYILPIRADDDGREVFDTGGYLLDSVVDQGFYVILEGVLWQLPKEQGRSAFIIYDISGNEFLVDYRVKDNIHLLLREFYGSGIFKLNILTLAMAKIDQRASEIEVDAIFVGDDYAVEYVDLDGVSLIGNKGGELLAVDWGGKPRWGRQYEWYKSSNISCGLGREVFMPVEGFVIGCQRKGWINI